MDNKPCLFDYAASELSQDAFFAWLLANADASGVEEVHDLSRLFLCKAFEMNNVSFPRDFTIHVERQYRNIDVFAVIDVNDNGKYAVILEDKIHTVDHDNQLKRYREEIEKEGKYCQVVCLYCKTGDQSNHKSVDEAGYAYFDRRLILDLMDTPEGRHAVETNAIVRDFVAHLNTMENLVSQYRNISIGDWKWNDWKGFFMALQREESKRDGNWDYVSNPSGGFMGFWWHWYPIENNQAYVYLQLEEGKACFKVECGELDAYELKWKWHEKIIKTAQAKGIGARKPNVMRKGYWMTVAVLDTEYRVATPEGKLDFQKTLDKLHEMELVLDAAVAEQ